MTLSSLPTIHNDALKGAIMLSGIYRSGTTMLGKIIGSLEHVEYSFEPPLAFYIDALLMEKRIDPQVAATLLQVHFAEDLMLNYHHGRGYNMRPTDDSCIFNMKTYKEVHDRWHAIGNVLDASKLMKELGSRFAFKTPATYYYLEMLMEQFPTLKIIEIKRDLRAVLSSVLAKEWFSDAALKNLEHPSFWPYVVNDDNMSVPYYLNKVPKQWSSWSEQTRAVYSLQKLAELSMETVERLVKKYPDRVMVLSYEEILDDATQKIGSIISFLVAKTTAKTKEFIEAIKPRPRVYNFDNVAKDCDKDVLLAFEQTNKTFGY